MVGVASMVEDVREPGAIELEDEPFDVVRANSSLDDGYEHTHSRTRNTKATYEVGEPPALSRNHGSSMEGSTVGVEISKNTGIPQATGIDLTRNVTGGRSSRTRPMNPPSRAGLDDPEVYQQQSRKGKQPKARKAGDGSGDDDDEEFGDDDDVMDETRTNPPSGFSRGSSYRNDMPMDERQEYEDEMKALALCDVGESSQGMPEFCDSALTAVGEMCGGGLGGGESSERIDTGETTEHKKGRKKSPNKPALKLGEKHTASSGVEEQTAIEVEYVEPLYRGKNGDESDRYASPKRKNSLLKAMTRKAKDDYKKGGKGKRGKSAERASQEQQLDPSSDNVYATFTNSEKRKFLQLINGGNTPFEATRRVLKERLESHDGSSVADSSFQSDVPSEGPMRSPSRSSGGLKKLAFWKRGSGKSPSPAKEMAQGDYTSSSPQQRPGSAPSTPGRVLGSGEGDDERELNNDEIYEDDASSTSSCEKVGDQVKQFLRDEAESIKAESVASSPSKSPGKQAKQQNEEDDRFEKSGISYYDAIRKDRSMEEEDEAYYYNDGEYPEDSNRRPRKIKLPKGFKGGFSKFRGGTNRATAVPGDESNENDEIPSQHASPKDHPVIEPHRSIPSPTKENHNEETVVLTSFDEVKKAAEENLVAAALEDAMTAKLMGRNNQMPDVESVADDQQLRRSAPKSPEEIVDDLNMDAYLNSTEDKSRNGVGNSGSFDATSVVSGKSFKTSGTNFTTQSTRSRRPGQAKARLQQDKSVLNISTTSSTKTRGWQESIEAVAARTGKIWDPETGWRDYTDPKNLESPGSGFYSESIDMGDDIEIVEAPSDPAQLTEWRDTQRIPTTPTRSTDSGSRKVKSPSRQRRSPKKTAAAASPDRPRGWAATMKAATAKLNMQGKKWDPEKGWTGLSENEAMIAIEVQRQSLNNNNVAITADSDLQDFGTMSAVQKLDEIANKQDKSIQFLSEDEEAGTNQLGDAETTDGDLSSSALSSSNANSKNNGRYIQIAESGSVREYSGQNRSRPVNVRKENLNKTDADFFPEGSAHQKIKGPVDLDDVFDQESASFGGDTRETIVSGPKANAVYQKIYESQSQGNGSFDGGEDFSWDADESTEPIDNTLDNRKAVPRLKIKIRDPQSAKSTGNAQSEASFESATSIPKLAAPRRDTSPIRSNRRTSKGRPTSELVPVSPSHEAHEERNEIRYEDAKDYGPVKDIVSLSPTRTPNAAEVAQVVRRITPTASKNPNKTTPKVSELHKMWEKKTKSWDKGQGPDPEEIAAKAENSEWKSFLVKKVQAESAAAGPIEKKDSVFEFEGSDDGNGPKSSRRRSKHGEPEDEAAFDDLSELSPIRHDESDSEYGRSSEVHSEASTSVLQGTTFLQRLQACAAPIVIKGSQIAKNQNCNPDGPISAHLAFLKSNPGVGGSPNKMGGIMQASAGLCGRPDIIVEDDEDETTVDDTTAQTPTKSSGRSRSNPRSRQHNIKDDLSSVVSDGFGAQSAYMEAIAMKAAVSGGSKKKKKRSQGSEASAATSHSRQSPSEVNSSTSANSKHSEKFQQFLDRRASKETSPQQLPDHKPPTGRTEVSNKAEKYASEKVDEMMDSMAGRDNRGRAKEDYEETGAFPTLPVSATPNPVNDASRMAAEELAAARVEVMMQTLSSQNLEDHEAEI
jgi:hypothetical protein